MTDLFGVPLNIGDRVIYTTGAQSNTPLEVGIIKEIKSVTRRNGITRTGAYIKTASGRTTFNIRQSFELVAVGPIAVQYPELFV